MNDLTQANAALAEIASVTGVLKEASSKLYGNKKLPLYVFEPFGRALVGLEQLTPEKMRTWMSLTMSPTAETDIYRDESFTELLFTVPPVYSTDIIDFDKTESKKYGDVVGDFTASSHPTALPIFGKELVNSFGDTINLDKTKEIASKNKLAWEKIRDFFLGGQEPITSVQSKQNKINDDFSFLQ